MNTFLNGIKHLACKSLIFLSLIFLFLIFFSCNKPEKKEILIDHISSTDFENNLTVDGVVDAVRSVTLTCPRNTEGSIIYLVKDGKMVKDSDVVCIIENRELNDEYVEMLIEVENTKASMAKTVANLNMQYALLDAQVKNNAAQTDIANLDSLQLIYASPVQRRIKELELQKAAIIKAKLEKKLKALDIINKSQIKRMELQIERRERRASTTKEQLDKLTLRAPQAGLALRAASYTTVNATVQEGDQVWGNMPLVTIPDLSEMKVKILASEATYKRINLNDSIEYSFDAMPGNYARGKIISKAPVGKPVKENSKVKFFEIEASVDTAFVLPKPGLTVSCKVIILNIKDTIVVPQLAIFDEDSIKVVYVKQSDGYERRQIKTGASSPKNAVVIAGLSGKESLSLIKPSSTLINKTTTLLPVPKLKQKTKTKTLQKVSSQPLKTKQN
jgi:HlyD family secretion protein